MDRQISYRNPGDMPPTAGYSHYVEVRGGRTIYLSGQVPLDSNGRIVGQTFSEQAEQVFRNIKTALMDAGADFGHVVKISMYIKDMDHLSALRAVRDRYLEPDRLPASSLFAVSGFFHPDILVEIEAIAVVD